MNASYWCKNIGFASVTAALVACNTQSVTFPTAMSPSGQAQVKKSDSGELLYASQNEGSQFAKVFVFSYPQGKLVQTLSFPQAPWFMCSDSSGDVFIPTTELTSAGVIYEFAHGGSQPIQALTDPGPGYAQACSVDPTTGNLAVANGPNVAVYAPGQGTPTIYEASDVGAKDCAYDNSGDLFVGSDDYVGKIAKLPAGGTSFSDITLSEAISTWHLQWWRNRLVIYAGAGVRAPYPIYQIRISGSNGVVSGPVLLYGDSKRRRGTFVQFALFGKTIVMPEGPNLTTLDLWHYPKGGNPYKLLNRRRRYSFFGVAISK